MAVTSMSLNDISNTFPQQNIVSEKSKETIKSSSEAFSIF